MVWSSTETIRRRARNAAAHQGFLGLHSAATTDFAKATHIKRGAGCESSRASDADGAQLASDGRRGLRRPPSLFIRFFTTLRRALSKLPGLVLSWPKVRRAMAIAASVRKLCNPPAFLVLVFVHVTG